MPVPAVTTLGYIEIGASSLNAWQHYAEDVLGATAIVEQDALLVRYDAEPWRLRIVETGEDDIVCAGFSVKNESDLEAIGERLKSIGHTITPALDTEIQARNALKMLITTDPGGLRIEIYVPDPTTNTPFVSPQGVSGFITGDQGLGHIVLCAPEPESTISFYQQGLGFRLSDHIEMATPRGPLLLTFLHCNPRHHTLALVPGAMPKRLHHMMLQTQEMDDVGYALDRAKRADIAITSSLGKHTNDKMTSFYMATPSGFDCEYGFGGVEIDDDTWQTTTYDATSFWGHTPP